MIEFERVTKTYGARRAVADVSFRVERGAFCALVGSSGAGKSTLLRMVNRLVPMSEGAIRLDGEDVTRLEPVALRRRMGYVVQSIGLFPHWTVAQNIATVPRLLHWPEARIAARVRALLELMRLEPAMGGLYPHQLSGGQQQRVGVARALAADPEVLLMDEPFGALDPITREELRIEIARIHKATGKTILFVTHDIDAALQMADAIAILRGGALVQLGTPAELLEHPADDFVRDFVGGTTLGLKLLAQRRVAEHVRKEAAPPGAPISRDATLTEALSQMVLRGTDILPVRDASGRIAGSVALADMIAP
ncbi:MAG TPA: ABC transporter ATP-binding protein [Stellaceae bacterium]|nr:ABC transporter ATP-binding protein [Stellaceae bacterium]